MHMTSLTGWRFLHEVDAQSSRARLLERQVAPVTQRVVVIVTHVGVLVVHFLHEVVALLLVDQRTALRMRTHSNMEFKTVRLIRTVVLFFTWINMVSDVIVPSAFMSYMYM